MNITKQEYQTMVNNASGKSKIIRDCLNAFWTGGLICILGQTFTDLFRMAGADIRSAGSLTSITLIFLSALFTAFGLYDNIAKFAGAGTLVPITGFANSVVSPALEFKSEGFIMGLGAKIFIIAGPVIAYGASASVLYGLVLSASKAFG